jgi:hypothetical protein
MRLEGLHGLLQCLPDVFGTGLQVLPGAFIGGLDLREPFLALLTLGAQGDELLLILDLVTLLDVTCLGLKGVDLSVPVVKPLLGFCDVFGFGQHWCVLR